VGKKKLIHFEENLSFGHLFQQSYPELMAGFPLKGLWNKDFFRNPHPIVLELGCGKGEYTVNLAQADPGRNFIGIDIKGARMWKGCKLVEERQIRNAAFVRSQIELLEHFFDPGEVSEIWITFPDPHEPNRRAHKRLTSPRFLERYRKILAPGGIIHLKTDNSLLYDYTLGIIRADGHELMLASDDLYRETGAEQARSVQTFYEAKFRSEGIPIKYLEFRLNHGG
jgi:tRNA (guanine-N7-)-methyltransferase